MRKKKSVEREKCKEAKQLQSGERACASHAVNAGLIFSVNCSKSERKTSGILIEKLKIKMAFFPPSPR